MKTEDVTGVVLAGGQSRRMGVDKASLVVGGRQMIAHVIDRLREVFPEVVVVAKDASRLEVPGVKVVADAISDKTGALVGIYSALRAARTPNVFVVACDMPYIRPELVRWMIEACKESDAFVPRIGAQIEPLFALYSQNCLAPIRNRLEAGDLRVRGFFQDVKMAYADEDRLRAIDPELASFVNINTRDDLQNARRTPSIPSVKGVPSLTMAEADAVSYRKVKVTRVKDAGEETEAASLADDSVIAETEISVMLNGEPVRRMQCSPHRLDALAAGHLLTEGFIGPGRRVAEARVDSATHQEGVSHVVDVRVQPLCSDIAGRESGSADEASLDLPPGSVCDAVDELLGKSPLFSLTGAAHAAALCSVCGIVYWSEDISRHNAVDRVAGQCLLSGSSFADKFLVTTGRINGEMVQKAASCGIQLVASKAPPTDRGIELAEELGITVVGFVRSRRFNVYSHSHRISGKWDACIRESGGEKGDS